MHERLMLWVVEPDRFVVLAPDGDMFEEMRETWRSAQIMMGPANVVAFTDPMEETEMTRHRCSRRDSACGRFWRRFARGTCPGGV